MLTTLIAIIVMAADIWAMISILGSPSPAGTKVAWVLVILLLPVLGLLVWLALGPRPGRV